MILRTLFWLFFLQVVHFSKVGLILRNKLPENILKILYNLTSTSSLDLPIFLQFLQMQQNLVLSRQVQTDRVRLINHLHNLHRRLSCSRLCRSRILITTTARAVGCRGRRNDGKDLSLPIKPVLDILSDLGGSVQNNRSMTWIDLITRRRTCRGNLREAQLLLERSDVGTQILKNSSPLTQDTIRCKQRILLLQKETAMVRRMTRGMDGQQGSLVIDLDNISVLNGLEPCLWVIAVWAWILEHSCGGRRDRGININQALAIRSGGRGSIGSGGGWVMELDITCGKEGEDIMDPADVVMVPV